MPKAVSKSRIIMPPASGVTFDGAGVETKPLEACANRSRATVVDDGAAGATCEGTAEGPRSIEPVVKGDITFLRGETFGGTAVGRPAVEDTIAAPSAVSFGAGPLSASVVYARFRSCASVRSATPIDENDGGEASGIVE